MLLEVDDVHTHFISRGLDNQIRTATALNGVSFQVERGRVLGIVGETGAGKSLTATTIMGLLRPPAKVVKGRVCFQDTDLLALPPGKINKLRGKRISMVVQNPRGSLDPLTRIGDQLVRIQKVHASVDSGVAKRRAVEALEAVGIPEPEARLLAWPHELSGGMAQRVLIAMALINGPDLLIADEPTTGLDVTVQAQILDLIRREVQVRGIGAIIITHDLGVVAHYCDDIAVMFAGSVVENGATRTVFRKPAHPYTNTLLAATPERLDLSKANLLGGPPPNLFALPKGCTYRDRCEFARDLCSSRPSDHRLDTSHVVKCHYPLTPVSTDG